MVGWPDVANNAVDFVRSPRILGAFIFLVTLGSCVFVGSLYLVMHASLDSANRMIAATDRMTVAVEQLKDVIVEKRIAYRGH